jgi:hypothetical protein
MGPVEVRLHGGEADVRAVAEALTELMGADFRDRVYRDRGGSGRVRAYGEIPSHDSHENEGRERPGTVAQCP